MKWLFITSLLTYVKCVVIKYEVCDPPPLTVSKRMWCQQFSGTREKHLRICFLKRYFDNLKNTDKCWEHQNPHESSTSITEYLHFVLLCSFFLNTRNTALEMHMQDLIRPSLASTHAPLSPRHWLPCDSLSGTSHLYFISFLRGSCDFINSAKVGGSWLLAPD